MTAIDCADHPQSLPLRTKTDVINAYPKLFTGLGKLKGEYTIQLRDDSIPFGITAPRRVPIPLLKKVEEEIL